MTRREWIRTAAAAASSTFATTGWLPAGAQEQQQDAAASKASRPPNIIFIYCDDLGFGDIGPYGSKIDTPNLNRMAAEGVMLRQFYASPLCSTSRAALLTGRYGVRSGIPGVLQPGDKYGLSTSETTIADLLKGQGYKTMCVGKWHLGTYPQYMPTQRGFDDYYGIPYSNDQDPCIMMRGMQIVESPVDQDMVTQRYTQTAIDFIQRSKDYPFFLYLPHTAPHFPLGASRDFRGKSSLGAYGDAIMEIDWSVGRIFETLANLDLDKNTLVIFSSDNGPWFQGSPGPLRGRKGGTFEGGMRVPFLARYPGVLPAGKVVQTFASTLDMLPTFARLANADMPGNPLDGVDIWPVLTGEVESVPRPLYLYFHEFDLQCARLGKWKLHVSRENVPPFVPNPSEGRMNLRLLNPELYDLEADQEESYDVAADNPKVVADIQARIASMLPGLPPQVQLAWKQTQSRPVNPNKSGEWPTSGN